MRTTGILRAALLAAAAAAAAAGAGASTSAVAIANAAAAAAAAPPPRDPLDPRGLRAPRRRLRDPTQCAYPSAKGCGALTWPVSWSMRGSLYMYCYINCSLAFFDAHRELGTFGGVVGVDHYWTHRAYTRRHARALARRPGCSP